MEYAVYMSGARQQDEVLCAENESFFSVSVLSKFCCAIYYRHQIHLTQKTRLIERVVDKGERATKWSLFVKTSLSILNPKLNRRTSYTSILPTAQQICQSLCPSLNTQDNIE